MPTSQEKVVYEASCFSWNGDILTGTFPPSRTLPISSPKCAAFWMKDETEVRSLVRTLQGALVSAGKAMQPPLTDEQIAWHKGELDAHK